MKWELYKPLPSKIEHKGRVYRLDLSFANVLRYTDLCENHEGLTDKDVVEIGFCWLVRTRRRLSTDDKAATISKIMSKYVYPPQKKLNTSKPQTVVDFNADSGYIYASFMQIYGIDLYSTAQKLHWCKFIALFDGLPEDCIIKQIMHIRAQDVPAPNKYNLKEIQRLTELKTLYALPSKQTEAEATDAWGKLFDVMERQAK